MIDGSHPTQASITRLAVVVTCHNRRDTTLGALRRVVDDCADPVQPIIYLLDDGSTDGTGDAVRREFPTARVIQGDGQHFWNRGMKRAFDLALQERSDFYLWLNDDSMLLEGAVGMLLLAAERARSATGGSAIVVGSTRDPSTGEMTYGGSRQLDPRWRPFKAVMLEPNGANQPVDLMNGNIVLIPDAAARILGSLDPVFEHAMGDTEYAMRAKARGIPVILAPSYAGVCARNPVGGTMADRSQSWRQRWRLALSRKGMPPMSWWHLCRLHGGRLWLAHFVWCYLRVALGR